MSANDRRPGLLPGLLALHFVVGGLLVAGYRFQINPDGIAYLATAGLHACSARIFAMGPVFRVCDSRYPPSSLFQPLNRWR